MRSFTTAAFKMTKRVRLFLSHTPSIPKLLITNLQISFTVHGDVQGVNFRYVQLRTRHHHRGEVHLLKPNVFFLSSVGKRSFTQKKATSYGLTGFVKNTPRGKVSHLCSPSLSPPQSPPPLLLHPFHSSTHASFYFFLIWATNRSKAKPKAPTSPCRNCSRISTVARRRRMWLRWRRVRWR